MKTFKDHVKDQKPLPVSYVGKDHPEIDKACEEHNKKKVRPKQLRLRLKENVDELIAKHKAKKDHESELPSYLFDVQRNYEAGHKLAHIPSFHYPAIKIRQQSLYDAHAAPHIREHGAAHFEAEFHKLKESHFDPVNHSYDDGQTIYHYTTGSKSLNQHLVSMHTKGVSPDPYMEHQHTEHTKKLNDLAARHKTTQDMHLWSGVGSAHPGKHPEGLHLPAFTSMTNHPGSLTGLLVLIGALNLTKPLTFLGRIDPHPETGEHPHFLLHPDVVKKIAEQTGIKEPSHLAYHLNAAMHSHPVNSGFFSSNYKYDNVSRPIVHALRIHVPAGSNVIHTGGHSDYPNENEIIAPAGSILHHTGQPPELHADGTLLHHVRLQTPDFNSPRKPSRQGRFDF